MTHDEADLPGVGLADAIGQVRAELERAVKEGEQSQIAFKPGSIELEFEVGFTKAAGVHGGFQLSVLAFGAKGERSSANTHRIRVALTPVDRAGQDKLISDTGLRNGQER